MVSTVKTSIQSDDFQELTEISVRGAREHNLKNISLKIPRDKLVVITGLSGSGKSSLAFDTIYAEGQRRYVECLSAYARQFLGMMRKPDADGVEGLSPAISIEQKSVGSNPRSTVGTVTEIYDYLRLLYARVGVQYCVDCNIPAQSQSPEHIVETIASMPLDTRLMILAPMVRSRKGHYRELFETLHKQGYLRVRVDGEIMEIEDGMQLSRYQNHNIDVVVDRCVAGLDQEERIASSVNTALRLGDGGTVVVLAENSDGTWSEKLFSTINACSQCGESYEELAPNKFSFNSPYGACSSCDGTGTVAEFDEDLVIPNRNLSVADGGIAILGKLRKVWTWTKVTAFADQVGIDLNIPVTDMEREQIQALLYGTGKQKIVVKYVTSQGKTLEYKTKFEGILPLYRSQYKQTESSDIRSNIEKYMSTQVCQECNGGRLQPQHLAVKINDKNISETTDMDIVDAVEYFKKLPSLLTKRQNMIAGIIIKEIVSRLEFLRNVGLHYLSLNRTARSLSGGESQRIRLASQIGSQLVGVTYVLDEPSIGLHQHDNDKLISSLKNLRDLGNSVIVVEHDREMIENADYIIDIGPGAGINGGNIVFSGNHSELLNKKNIKNSSTAQYLTGIKKIEIPKDRRKGNGNWIRINNARGNNLKHVTLEIPLGALTCITGMSGSGKSSLINHTLYPALSRHFHNSLNVPLPYDSIEGLEHIDKVIEINQKPIGRTPRSNPATYTGVFTPIRDLFAQMPEARMRGYEMGRFSFNVKGGRCEECQGGGMKTIEMNYLPEVTVQCEICGGKRYNSETLTVTYRDKSIADVLDMSIEEAYTFFSEIPKVKKILKTLNDVGLGYIKVGQQAPTLSGGEAQRVKLAAELSKTQTGKTLYVLDEPTTGLHFDDILLLLKLLNDLVEKGNTVIVIEHNLDVIKVADYIVDIGPEGGKHGGKIIASGSPEIIAATKKSYTGHYLQKELAMN